MTETTSINNVACLILLSTLSYVFEIKKYVLPIFTLTERKLVYLHSFTRARVCVCLNCIVFFPSGLTYWGHKFDQLHCDNA